MWVTDQIEQHCSALPPHFRIRTTTTTWQGDKPRTRGCSHSEASQLRPKSFHPNRNRFRAWSFMIESALDMSCLDVQKGAGGGGGRRGDWTDGRTDGQENGQLKKRGTLPSLFSSFLRSFLRSFRLPPTPNIPVIRSLLYSALIPKPDTPL